MIAISCIDRGVYLVHGVYLEQWIKIFGFERTNDVGEGTEDDTRVLRYFPTLSVFDIAQTDPIG